MRLLALLMFVLAAAGCGSSATTSSADSGAADGAQDVQLPVSPSTATPEPTSVGDSGDSDVTSAPESDPVEPAAEPAPPLVAVGTALPPAPIGFEAITQSAADRAVPVSIEIENINVRNAQVIPVGVNPDDLSFEVPPADQVGWYEFGSAPGEAGSAVLAAHIAYNGVDGVFRKLADVEVGSVVVIGFDDGSTSRFRIEEVVEYVKQDLPDSLFARDGDERLALITCGGNFNYQLESYESNSVAIAVAI